MIPSDLLVAYATVRHDLDALKARIDPILITVATERDGLYTSRIKSPASIFDKTIMGSYMSPLLEMEDLVAATIVLPSAPTGEERKLLEDELTERFELHETRTNRTRKPSEFIYDDLHYILRVRDSHLLTNKRLLIWPFELQVKSYLQHGLSKALHNSVYKSEHESWRASRVASETRALVEVAEAVLAVGEDLLPNTAERSFLPIDERVQIIRMLSEWWMGDLPKDRRRLGRFVSEFIALASLSLERFQEILDSARGSELKLKSSLSIQQAIIILLLENRGTRLIQKLKQKGDRFLVVTSEMEAISAACASVPSEVRVSLVSSRI